MSVCDDAWLCLYSFLRLHTHARLSFGNNTATDLFRSPSFHSKRYLTACLLRKCLTPTAALFWFVVAETDCSELQYVLENSQSAAVLTTEEYADKMAPLADKANIQLHLLSPRNSNSAQSGMSPLAQAALSHEAENVDNMLHSQLDSVALAEDDGALIVYTSGTTGRPKGQHRSSSTSLVLLCTCAGLAAMRCTCHITVQLLAKHCRHKQNTHAVCSNRVAAHLLCNVLLLHGASSD